MSNSWSNAPAAEAFMQGDEAGETGEEGSGSGRNYAYDDGSFDAEGGSGEEGSGSPDGPVGIGTHSREGTMESSTPKTGGSAAARPAAALLAAALLAARTAAAAAA
ncbi:hypothetical protein MSG28_000543 [Choristoneura fumiferana]|uniref:Uncharacterized protein n=2 Tax=Choristoneura fumiferana TaxID=7141 RepID=A0ACC0K1C3_CHOFU|nr:hypothetical protein MSG28_000543 [Choristoneura fumiferana]